MKWLVSFRGQYIYQRPDGSLSRNEPDYFMWLVEDHPARFVARNTLALHNLSATPYDMSKQPPRAMNVICIYSAIEVPAGTLPLEQEESLQ